MKRTALIATVLLTVFLLALVLSSCQEQVPAEDHSPDSLAQSTTVPETAEHAADEPSVTDERIHQETGVSTEPISEPMTEPVTELYPVPTTEPCTESVSEFCTEEPTVPSEPICVHTWSSWNTEAAATCLETGREIRSCTKCGEVEARSLSALGHSMGAWTQTAAPTCTAAGSEARSCSRCGKAETRTLNALGHSMGAWTQTKAPTCGADGTETRSCSRCGQTESRTVAATGNHSWNETTPPTCTAAGIKTCAICGTTENTAALGHDWVHHDEGGHWQPVLTCRCGAVFYSYDEWYAHSKENCEDGCTGFSQYSEWIVDQPAYDICSRCGAVK